MRSSRYKKTSSRIAKRQKARKYAGLVLKIGTPTAVLVGLVFLLRANFLQIKDFEMIGMPVNTDIIKNEAVNFVSGNYFYLIPRTNILLLNKNNLASDLEAKFKRIEKAEISKKYFSRTIKILIAERVGIFLWCSTQDECYAMDMNGLVFEKTVKTEDRVIFRGNIEGDPIMKNFDTPAKMQNYAKLISILKDAGFPITSINIESNDKATAKTKIGDIIFNPQETDLFVTAQNVVLLINEVRSKKPSVIFDYIDARFDNKMFYKLI